MFKKFIKVFLVLFLLNNLVVFTHASEYPIPTLNAVSSAVVMDADDGSILYSLNPNQRVYPASTTKIMTLLLALENKQPNDLLTMSYEATHHIEANSSHIALKENEVITVEQAMYATSISSANDAANGLAESIAKTQDDFALLMNERAKQLNANNTHFTNAHGLHNEQHYTTAYDFALIMKEAIKHPDFLKYLSTTYFELLPTELTDESRYLHSTNRTLLKDTNQYVEGILASKTGYTTDAGHTQVSYASRNGRNIIVTVFGGTDRLGRYNDTKALFEYAFENFDFIDTSNISIEVPDFDLPKKYKFENDYSINIPNQILAYKDTSNFPIKSNVTLLPLDKDLKTGDVIGNIEFIQNEQVISNHSIVLNSPLVKKNTFLDLIIKISKLILCLVCFIILILFSIRQYFKHQKRKRRRH